MTTTHLKFAATCPTCGFTSADIGLLNSHSCDVQANGGRCEDYPCCGHEAGDCNGLLYGSDESIKSDPHLLCDHNTGTCEVWEREQYDDPEDDFADGEDRVTLLGE
jgi:hypothetical protein